MCTMYVNNEFEIINNAEDFASLIEQNMGSAAKEHFYSSYYHFSEYDELEKENQKLKDDKTNLKDELHNILEKINDIIDSTIDKENLFSSNNIPVQEIEILMQYIAGVSNKQ